MCVDFRRPLHESKFPRDLVPSRGFIVVPNCATDSPFFSIPSFRSRKIVVSWVRVVFPYSMPITVAFPSSVSFFFYRRIILIKRQRTEAPPRRDIAWPLGQRVTRLRQLRRSYSRRLILCLNPYSSLLFFANLNSPVVCGAGSYPPSLSFLKSCGRAG